MKLYVIYDFDFTNMTIARCGTGTAYSSRAPVFILVFHDGFAAQFSVFCKTFC